MRWLDTSRRCTTWTQNTQDRPRNEGVKQRRRSRGAGCPPPNVLSGGVQLLNGPTQYLTLNSVLNYSWVWNMSCYFTYAVVIIMVVIIISQSAVICSLTFRFVTELLKIDRQVSRSSGLCFQSRIWNCSLPKVATGSTPLELKASGGGYSNYTHVHFKQCDLQEEI